MRSIRRSIALAVTLTLAIAATGNAFTWFETGLVRPLAMSPNGNRLFACNTPDNTLEVFDITVAGSSSTTASSAT
jgi:hypothetical protein